MKVIKTVSPKGIEYVDENGEIRYVDFESCYANWLKRESERTDPYYDDRARQNAQGWKCVGQRDRYAQPLYIEFFTEPITRFEFESAVAGFHDLRRKVEKAGWRTSDLG